MKRVFLVLLVLIAAAVAFVASRPATFHLERSTTIAAAPEAVFPHVNDFHRWGAWSPWEKLDPNMVRTFGGPESGNGSTYHWTGNKAVGEGNMTITESTPHQAVGIKLEFIKPYAATSTARFALTPAAGGTQVTWSMDGENNFVSKAMCIFVSMDKMVGGDFERGLAALKTVSESTAQSPAPTPASPDSTH